ncbi:GNAT family N-acetyltransferase [Actinocorallia sp. A-T 12471]|uniref:GNAT family N-acetyltransferase n=1 Tax=Actinocorallia sp. A-T 12471 TaxID=3089813 RepID=UPI0029D07A25|nr:GNAT family N-acetyltransferase [Actinocorallia sp. A-T 12471]MDX6743058.1 GNAT family N-acetyltransferase [Actinocorallia sp. A-T 12471]
MGGPEVEGAEIVLAEGPDALGEAFEVRWEVFVGEQGVPAELEADELDDVADHFLARVAGVPLGAVRLLVRNGTTTGVLGRLAVRKAARGTGLGAALVRALEDHARGRGLTAIELHAQTHATGFYTRLGYTQYGPEELEAGIPHIWMRRDL